MENLSSKTLKELKAYAEENNIDLNGAKTKTKVLSIIMGNNSSIQESPVPEQTVITGPDQVKRSPVSSSASNDEGTVISRGAERPSKKTTETPKEESTKVAVFSKRNLRWSKLGQLSSGYNIVTKEAAATWVTLPGVRKATKEEVASYYGKE
jgi:hypothetical protein